MSASHGQWASVRINTLGDDFHPLSLTVVQQEGLTTYRAIVSAQGGDWSQSLVNLAQDGVCTCQIEMKGPYPASNWLCATDGSVKTVTMLIAGGTGITAWLPVLHDFSRSGRQCRLVCDSLHVPWQSALCIPSLFAHERTDARRAWLHIYCRYGAFGRKRITLRLRICCRERQVCLMYESTSLARGVTRCP